MAKKMKISPSILSADFTRLADELALIEEAGADYVHVDVMDGRFVPNITIGPFVVEAIKRATSLPLDVHLMIEEPERYIPDFAKAGSSIITVHVEATAHLNKAVQMIKEHGARAGVTLNPATPVETLTEIMDEVDLVLVMSVNPGFSGQGLNPGGPGEKRGEKKNNGGGGPLGKARGGRGIKFDNIADAARA